MLSPANRIIPQAPLDYTCTGKTDREGSSFSSDAAVPWLFRASNNDYLRSGYSRGHLAAASNHKSSNEDMNSTFLLSNIVPQV